MKRLLLLLAPVTFGAGLTVQDAKKFLDEAEAKLLILSNESGRADWVHSNFITDDTEAIASEADEKFIAEGVRLAKGAARFDGMALPELIKQAHAGGAVCLDSAGRRHPRRW